MRDPSANSDVPAESGGLASGGPTNQGRTAAAAFSAAGQRLLRQRLTGLIGAILITMVFFQSQNSYFLTVDNMLALTRAMSSLAIIAFAQTLVIVSGELDLSVGSIYGLAAMVTAVVWEGGTSLVTALLLGLGAGVLAGIINAFVTIFLQVPSFIATLGMLSLASGIGFLISNSQSVNAGRDQPGFGFFNALSNRELPLDVPPQVLWLLAFAVVFHFLLRSTLFGFRLSAIGGNGEAAARAGLPVRRYKFCVFALSGLCAAVAGLLDFSLIGATTPNSGAALTFPVFAAVIIGGASLLGGRGSIMGTIAGAFLLTMLSNGLSLLGVGTYAQLILTGLVTIGAVALDRWTAGRVIRVQA